MSVRQSLRNLQRYGEFIAAFTSKKKDDDQKSLFHNWQLIQNFFIAHLFANPCTM
jgi:hypothetical protein